MSALPPPSISNNLFKHHCACAEMAMVSKDYVKTMVHCQRAIKLNKHVSIENEKELLLLNQINKTIVNTEKKLSVEEKKLVKLECLFLEGEENIKIGLLDDALNNYKLAFQQIENDERDYAKTWESLLFHKDFEAWKIEALKRQANVLQSLEDDESLIDVYQKLIEIQKKRKENNEYCLRIADCYYRLGIKTKSNSHFEKAQYYYKETFNARVQAQYYSIETRIHLSHYRMAYSYFCLGHYQEAIESANLVKNKKSKSIICAALLVKANAELALENYLDAKNAFKIVKKVKFNNFEFSDRFLHPQVGIYVAKAQFLYKKEQNYLDAQEYYVKAIDFAKLNCQKLIPFLSMQHTKPSELFNVMHKTYTKFQKENSSSALIKKTNIKDLSEYYYDIYEHVTVLSKQKDDLIYLLNYRVKNLVFAYWLGHPKAAQELKGNIEDLIPGVQVDLAIDMEVAARLNKITIDDKNYSIAQRVLFEIYFFSKRFYTTYRDIPERLADIKKCFQHLVNSCNTAQNFDNNDLFTKFHFNADELVQNPEQDNFLTAFHLSEYINEDGRMSHDNLERLSYRAQNNEVMGREDFPPFELLLYSQAQAKAFTPIHREINLYRVGLLQWQKFNHFSKHVTFAKAILDKNKSYCLPIDGTMLKKPITIFLNNENIEVMRVRTTSSEIVFTGYGDPITLNFVDKNIPLERISISNRRGGHHLTKISGFELPNLQSFNAQVDQLAFDINSNPKEFKVHGLGVIFTKALTVDLLKLNVKGIIVEKESRVHAIHTIIQDKPLMNISGIFHAISGLVDGDSIDLIEGSTLKLENSRIKSTGTFKTRNGASFLYHHSEIETSDSIEIHKGGKWEPDTKGHNESSALIIKTDKTYKMEGALGVGEFSLQAEEDHFDGHVKAYRKNNFRLKQNVTVDGKIFGFMVTSKRGYLSGNFEIPVGRFNRNHYAIHGIISFPENLQKFKELLAKKTYISSYPIGKNGVAAVPQANDPVLLEFISPIELSINVEIQTNTPQSCNVLRADFFCKRPREKSVVLLPVGFSIQSIQNAYDDACYILRMIQDHNFSAIRQEIKHKLPLDNVIYWLVWLIRKLVPSLNSVANLSYALYTLARQSRDIGRKCKNLYEQWQKGIPIQNYQLLELLSAAAPLAQLSITIATDGMNLKNEGIPSINFNIPNFSLETLKDVSILTAQLLAARESCTGLSNIGNFGISGNLLTSSNSTWILDSDIGKIMPSICQSSTAVYGLHRGGFKISFSVFEQAYISDSRYRAIVTDSFYQETTRDLWIDQTTYSWSCSLAITTDNILDYKDFFKRQGRFTHLVASDYSLNIGNEVEFNKAFESAYRIHLTTRFAAPVSINAPIKAKEFGLTVVHGDITNNSHIACDDNVLLCSVHDNVYNNCKNTRDGWKPASINTTNGNIFLIAGNQVYNTGNAIAENGQVVFLGDKRVFITALTREITTHKTHRSWLGLVKREITTTSVEVHNPILTGKIVVFNAKHGILTIVGVSFNCDTESYGGSIIELPIVVNSVTKEKNSILWGALGGSHSTRIDQIATPTEHHAYSAFFFATNDSVILDGTRIWVGFLKIKARKQFIAKCRILNHSFKETRWGITPSLHVPLVSDVQAIVKDVQTFTYCTDPEAVALNSITAAADIGNGVHQAIEGTSFVPSSKLSLNVSHTHAEFQTPSDASITAGHMVIDAPIAIFDGVPVYADTADLNVPEIFVSGVRLQSSIREWSFGLSVSVNLLGEFGGGLNASVYKGNSSICEHILFAVGKLNLPETEQFDLNNADLYAGEANGNIHHLRTISNQDVFKDKGMSLGADSNDSASLHLSASGSTITNESHFVTGYSPKLKIGEAEKIGSEVDALGAEIGTMHYTNLYDHSHSFSLGFSVNFKEFAKPSSGSKPLFTPLRAEFSEQRSSGINGHMTQNHSAMYNMTLVVSNKYSFETIAKDFRKFLNACNVPKRDRVERQITKPSLPKKNLNAEEETNLEVLAVDPTQFASVSEEPKNPEKPETQPDSNDPKASRMLPQQLAYSQFGRLLFNSVSNFVNNSYTTHISTGVIEAFNILEATIAEPFSMVNDLGIVLVKKMAPYADEDSLLSFLDDNISQQNYDLALERFHERSNAFSRISRGLGDIFVVMAAVGAGAVDAPLSPNEVAFYQRNIDRFKQNITNIYNSFVHKSGPEKAETISYIAICFIAPTSMVKGAEVLLNYENFLRFPLPPVYFSEDYVHKMEEFAHGLHIAHLRELYTDYDECDEQDNFNESMNGIRSGEFPINSNAFPLIFSSDSYRPPLAASFDSSRSMGDEIEPTLKLALMNSKIKLHF